MNSNPQLCLVVLAAGKGTRMKSDKAKVLHEVFFAPMVHHVLHALAPLEARRTIVIVGHQREAVENSLSPFDVVTVTQQEQLGTGHAVAIAQEAIPGNVETVMILCGDTPLVRSAALAQMYTTHTGHGAELTVMTTLLDDPTNYGRILTDASGTVLGIVEEKDATPEQKKIREINAGIYCVNRQFLFESLALVDTNNSQGEMYLTDIVGIAVKAGKKVERYICAHPHDVLGVNSRVELAQAHKALQQRRNADIMLQGITMHSPESIVVSPNTVIGRDTMLMAGVQLSGHTRIGEKCLLRQGVILTDCTVGDNVDIGPYCVLQNRTIPNGTVVAPHTTGN